MTATARLSPLDFILTTSLYDRVILKTQEDREAAKGVLEYSGTFDSYCTQCCKESTFQAAPSGYNQRINTVNPGQPIQVRRTTIEAGLYTTITQCTRVHEHEQYYIYRVCSEVCKNEEGKHFNCMSISKIGQFPSLGDILIPNVKRYARVLEKSKLDEIIRATGLNAHGIGVGAYVYLRRVFEFLVEEAHKSAASDSGWDESKYAASRMDEKITLLRSHLPSFLVENKAMYSLLSKGIHELSEEECLKHFDPLYTGIELILDELLVKHEREQKEAKAKKALNQAMSAAKSVAADPTSK
jgi:hypothetical protein